MSYVAPDDAELRRHYADLTDEGLLREAAHGAAGYRPGVWQVIADELHRRGLQLAPPMPQATRGPGRPQDRLTVGMRVAALPAVAATVVSYVQVWESLYLGLFSVTGPLVLGAITFFAIALATDLWLHFRRTRRPATREVGERVER